MKAIILAGGVGSRLRPMTCDCPKPMAPVMGRPAMEHAVRLLKRHGVEEIAATLCYLPGQIREHFGSGSRFGVKMRYYMENEPLGTAGGVKLAQEFLDETFFVLSGDGLTDCDLTDALRFHREKRAAATIVLKEAAEPTEYGVAVTEEDGRIRHFLEKPDWSDVLSDRVNTGIYILEPEVLRLIPEGVQADFSRDLFPKLMAGGEDVFGYPLSGYWCDIGDVESYLGAHRAILQGEAKVEEGYASGEVFVHPTARVDRGAVLEAPCAIGPGAIVESGARIGAGSYIGEGARIGRGAQVKRSVLWKGAVMEERAQACGCVLCDGAVLERDSCAYEASVIGKGSVLGRGAVLAPGARVWPGKRIEEFGRVYSDIVWGSGCGLKFRNGRMKLFGPEQALRLGRAMAKCMPAPVVIGHDGKGGAQNCQAALMAGLQTDRACIDAGKLALPALRELCRLLGAGAGAYCAGSRVIPLCGSGAMPPRGVLRRIEKEFCAERMPDGFALSTGPERITGAEQLYLGALGARFAGDGGGSCRVFGPDEDCLSLAQQALARAGWACRASLGDRLPDDAGRTAFLLDEDGVLTGAADAAAALRGEQLGALLVWTALEEGEKEIPIAQGAPEMLREICREHGAQTKDVHSGEGEEQSAMAEVCPVLLRLRTDGIFAALSVLRALSRRGWSLGEWTEHMPKAAVLAQSVPVETARKGKVLRGLAEQFPQAQLGDGIRISTETGRVWVRPSSDSAECRVSCEAADMESASELLERFSRILCPER